MYFQVLSFTPVYVFHGSILFVIVYFASMEESDGNSMDAVEGFIKASI